PIDIAFEGGIDEASLRPNAIVELGPKVIPNPEQNVFLIELAYPSGDPTQGLKAEETPTIPMAVTVAGAASVPDLEDQLREEALNPSYRAKVLDLDGTTVLRIQPAKPLKPKTRYLVVV